MPRKTTTAQIGKKTTRTARIQRASTQRRERQKQELRRLILDAAGQLFLEKGYENFSLRQVAERIGYSATTIYLYFQNKDDLILETVKDGFQDFDRKMEEIAGGEGDPLQRIEALGRAYIEFGLKNPALYRLMFMQRSDFYIMPHLDDQQIDSNVVENVVVPAPALAPEANGKAMKGRNTKKNEKAAVPPHDLTASSPRASGFDHPRTVARALLATTVKEAMDAGLLRKEEPLVLADVLWAGAHGLVSLALSPLMSPEHSQRVIDPLLQSLIEGVKRH